MKKTLNKKVVDTSLSSLVKKFSKNDVIAELEKEYQSSGGKSLPLSLIDDNAFIKRVKLSSSTIVRLGKNIAEKGLWNPLVVRPSGTHYELILGRKRYFGAKNAGLDEVSCVILNPSDEETLLMLLADARDQREANVVEMAMIFKALNEKFSYSQQTLANISHESRSQVTNTMRILNLPDHILDDIASGKLSYGHAKAIASNSDEEIERIVWLIYDQKLSVRETERLAKNVSAATTLEPSREEVLAFKTRADGVLIKRNSVIFNFKDETEKEAFLDKLETLSDISKK